MSDEKSKTEAGLQALRARYHNRYLRWVKSLPPRLKEREERTVRYLLRRLKDFES